MKLSNLPLLTPAVIKHVEDAFDNDPIAQRLRELGFVQDEKISIVAVGPVSADPLMIQVGFTRFALRRSEAQRVHVQTVS